MRLISKQRKLNVLMALVMIVALAISFSSMGFAATKKTTTPAETAKNIIVLVPDGMNVACTTLARWYKGSALTLDEMVVGAVQTYCANSIITDSAPAATAFATGYKSDDKYIGVYPSVIDLPQAQAVSFEDQFRPLATVLEAAKFMGKGTGLIATSNIQHATPAAFSAHWPSRSAYDIIAEQQVYHGVDVVFGGGKQYLVPAAQGGARKSDGDNLVDALKKMGYDFVENSDQLNNSSASKIWGMFAADAMNYDYDRDSVLQPSLAEMTTKAISVLSKNPKGFFLMVEGSKVDWAAHANDPIGVLSDTLAFDEAVKVAMDFAKKDKNTLVLAFSDHNTGGMTIGNKETDANYSSLKVSTVVEPLKKALLTGEGIERYLSADRSNVEQIMATYYGITDLKPEEVEAIKKAKAGSLNGVVGPMISKRSGIGWTTGGHTGEDVLLYAYGPGKPAGLIENTDVAKLIAKCWNFNLDDITKKLYVEPADTDCDEWGVRGLDKKFGENNPYIIIKKGNTTLELVADTSIVYVNGKQQYLKNCSYIINGRPFVPQEAVDLLKAKK